MVITHGGNLFAVARAHGSHWRDLLDFSASITPLGPAPGVRDAIITALDEIVHYPDPYAARLTEALATNWNVEPDAILTGNGATDLIHFLARTPLRRVCFAIELNQRVVSAVRDDRVQRRATHIPIADHSDVPVHYFPARL